VVIPDRRPTVSKCRDDFKMVPAMTQSLVEYLTDGIIAFVFICEVWLGSAILAEFCKGTCLDSLCEIVVQKTLLQKSFP